MDTLGTTIRQRREILGLSQMQLSERTQGRISQTYISALERGAALNITLSKLQILATALEVSVAVLAAAPTEKAAIPLTKRARRKVVSNYC